MFSTGLRVIVLFALGFLLVACHDPYEEYHYTESYIEYDDYKYIYYSFEPYQTYRVELITYSGDADVAIYNEYGERVVHSEEFYTNTDEVIFTADNSQYEIEIYGNERSEYELYIERLDYDNTGLSVELDSMEFIISADSFTGNTFSILASKSFQVSHAFDMLTVKPLQDFAWLDVSPDGTLYRSDYGDSATITVNILETQFPASKNMDSLMIRSQDYLGKINIFRELDVIYRVSE